MGRRYFANVCVLIFVSCFASGCRSIPSHASTTPNVREISNPGILAVRNSYARRQRAPDVAGSDGRQAFSLAFGFLAKRGPDSSSNDCE